MKVHMNNRITRLELMKKVQERRINNSFHSKVTNEKGGIIRRTYVRNHIYVP